MVNVINYLGYCEIQSPKCDFSVFDITGRLLFQKKETTSLVLTGNKFPSGIYNIILDDGINTQFIKVTL